MRSAAITNDRDWRIRSSSDRAAVNWRSVGDEAPISSVSARKYFLSPSGLERRKFDLFAVEELQLGQYVNRK